MEKIKVCILCILLVVISIGNVNGINEPMHKISKEKSNTNLQGTIVVNESKYHLIIPIIEIPHDQTLNIYAKKVDDFFLINSTLRINVVTNFDYHYRIDRYLKTVVVITRPGYSFLYRIIGKVINFNRTNVISNDNIFIDIPFNYRATENDELVRIFIFAFGNVYHTHKVIDVVCHYSDSMDTIPPVTTCYLIGKELPT